MKKSLLFFIILFSFSVAFGQNELLVQQSEGTLYLSHTVAPKESFYSIGRLYNVPPKEIATFNTIDMNNGLHIGQVVKIPLNAGNFTQAAAKGRPVYYVVGEKEGLYRVSMKNNKVDMASLRQWNHLPNDNIVAGKKLIVGYLVSPEAANIVSNTTATPSQPEAEKKVVETPKKEVAQQDPPKEKKPEAVPTREPERKGETSSVKPVSNPVAVNDGNGGYFKALYEKQVRAQSPKGEQTVSAGIFKTASGWQDAKYYALIDNVEPGTIIRIVNPSNNKAVYAKVLGEMSGIRQNQGYDLRLSNAAASALEIGDTDKFVVRVNY